MSDSYTEVTSQSWFSRIGDSLKGIIIGFIMFLVAFPWLFLNEGRAVRRYNALADGAGQVISVPSQSVDSANEGKLVHVYGKVEGGSPLVDTVFGVSEPGLQLVRKVEMYQWHESSSKKTEKKLGGGTETKTTYSYREDWSERVISSSGFKKPEGHQNPTTKAYESQRWLAQDATMGAFRISPAQIGKIGGLAPYNINSIPKAIEQKAQLAHSGVFFGADPNAPQIGDLRVTFRLAPTQDASIVAKQMGKQLTAHAVEDGSIELVQRGVVSADAMFKKAESDNAMFTWLLRFGGFLVMMIGIYTMLKVLAVIGDIVPFIGSMIAGGLGIVSFLVAAPLSLLTIAIAWIYYRPLLGIALIAVAVACIVALKFKVPKRAAPVGRPEAA